MISMIFDLDDTLYFQKEQFVKAAIKNIGEFGEVDLDRLYEQFQYFSEQAYIMRERGDITFQEMRIQRIKEAYKAEGIYLSQEECLRWQTDYLYEQAHISLSPAVEAILDYCHRQPMEMGIITNGPSDHQRMKLAALGLDRWFSPQQILVSGDVGVSKPARKVFDQMATRLSGNPRYYIGDNPVNDVQGALNAGWLPIWLNTKGESLANQAGVIEVTDHVELLACIKAIQTNELSDNSVNP
ncbi:HAD family hydrolase [Vagococcus sp. BWB3-3]|uniref:HAD family hydrolase n=1 Tax=Vagococcus allomyrinae TaxID=2794353 RepID=A0A940PDY9_9ENTE|nr:HAD family hydrolase [Vagococcus allomyrinae]MBP1042213.1 HAD family hydrolase [Vagococcus allomyrinae]